MNQPNKIQYKNPQKLLIPALNRLYTPSKNNYFAKKKKHFDYVKLQAISAGQGMYQEWTSKPMYSRWIRTSPQPYWKIMYNIVLQTIFSTNFQIMFY